MDDTATSKQVLKKESATRRTGDVPGHATCWHIQPYRRILASIADGKTLDISPSCC